MELSKKSFISFFITFVLCINGSAQNIPDQLRSWLSTSELSKIKKANTRIDQGKQILFSQQLQNQNDSLPEEEQNYLTLSENISINKKTSRLLIETKDYFASGFDSKLEVYKAYLDHFLWSDSTNTYTKAHILKDSIDIYISDAQLFRDRSETKGNLIAAANYINQSNKNLQSAIILCEKALILIKEAEPLKTSDTTSKNLSITRELVVQKSDEPKETRNEAIPDLTEEKNKTSNVTKEKVSTPQNKPNNEIKKAPVKTGSHEVYFTVQILADKKPVSNVRLKAVYKGDLPIIENQGDGWYRYSIGKFNNYSSAKKALLNSNTKGYVVAYKNTTRITVREAITYLQQINQ